jgi:tight adherence protein C
LIKKQAGLKILLYFVGVLLAVGGPRFYLSSRIKKRQSAIQKEMPDILDLLTVSVEAGLGFDAALGYISQYSKGPLVEEFNIVQKEIQMGRPRREALKKMEERSNITELKAFIGAIIQTDQMGVPIKNVLQAQASQLRTGRKQAAEEKALKAPIKMMFPLVVFIFPVIFIILLGPTVLQIIDTFKK